MRLLSIVSLFVSFACPALAGDYPDLRGTWTGIVDRVLFDIDGSPLFQSEEIFIEIVEQQDRRFVGRLIVEPDNVPIVGVFFDETRFRWTEPSGFSDAWMLDENTFEACYSRPAPFALLTGCETMTRQSP